MTFFDVRIPGLPMTVVQAHGNCVQPLTVDETTPRPTKLLIFGNPKAGSPVMIVAPSSAIDLPLKVLVRQDAGGKVWVSYNSPTYLQARHHLPPELLPNLAVIETLAIAVAE